MSASLSLAMSLFACTASETGGSEGRQPVQTAGKPVTVVDVGLLPSTWSAADGWILGYVRLLGDVDGDGYGDAAVTAFDGLGGPESTLLVSGPLRDAKTLPGDEFASFENVGVIAHGDATGDGIIDLDFVSWAWLGAVLVPGPFSGPVTDVAAMGMSHRFGLLDFDGDGILDQWTLGDPDIDRVEITWGPDSRWTADAPPDVVIAPNCGGNNASDWLYRADPNVWPDVTGDGQRELWVAGYSEFPGQPCGGYLLPVPAGGTVDPEQMSEAFSGVPGDFQVVGDQTADGLDDVFLPAERAVVAAPVGVSAGAFTSAVRIDIAPDLLRVIPQPFDLDGDGATDFVGMDADVDNDTLYIGPETWFVISGAAGLSSPSYDTAYDFHGGYPASNTGFVEDGRAVLPVVVAGSITMVDLGATTAVP